MNANKEYTADSDALRSGISMAERRAKYAAYINSKMNMDVSLGSQFQNDPQLILAHIDPVTVAKIQKMNPIWLAASAE